MLSALGMLGVAQAGANEEINLRWVENDAIYEHAKCAIVPLKEESRQLENALMSLIRRKSWEPLEAALGAWIMELDARIEELKVITESSWTPARDLNLEQLRDLRQRVELGKILPDYLD